MVPPPQLVTQSTTGAAAAAPATGSVTSPAVPTVTPPSPVTPPHVAPVASRRAVESETAKALRTATDRRAEEQRLREMEKAESDQRAKLAQMEKERSKQTAMQSLMADDAYSAEREAFETEQQRLAEYRKKMEREEQQRQDVMRHEQEATAQDQRDFLNPDMVSIKVIFPNDDMREIYRFHFPKDRALLHELKAIISKEFGYETHQQRFFYHHKELPNETEFAKLPKFDAKNCYLRFYPTSPPVGAVEHIFRPLQPDAAPEALKVQSFFKEGVAPARIPPMRDWINEQIAIEMRPRINPQDRLSVDKAMLELERAFESACVKGAALVLDGQVTPCTVLPELFGSEGERYVVSGILLRRVANWEILGEDIGEGDVAFKVAGHEARCLGVIRNRVPGLIAPLSALVDHFGIRFLCQAIPPIDFNTLAYGSSSDALIIQSSQDALPVAAQMARLFNAKPHEVVERLSNSAVPLLLPVSVELHRNAALADPTAEPAKGDNQPRLFVTNVGRCLPPDISTTNLNEMDGIDSLSRMLRPELVEDYGAGEQVLPGYVMFNQVDPHVCGMCKQVIQDYEYYYYEKRSYYVCPKCFKGAKPADFEFAQSKLVHKTVPPAQRRIYWRHETTGDVQYNKPLKLTPLNPDAYFAHDEAGVAEIRACAHYLQDTVIPRFLAELENLECTPLTGADLTAEMHKRGINMRYIGRLAQLRFSHLRQLAVREMLARTIKVLIRDGLFFMNEGKHYAEDDAKAVVVHYLNEIFTSSPSESSATMWRYIDELTQKKFDYALGAGSGVEARDAVRNRLYLLALLHSICEKVGIVLRKYRGYDFSQAQPFTVEDIDSVLPRPKAAAPPCDGVEEVLARARETDTRGRRSVWHLPGGPERAEASELFRSATTLAEYVYGTQDARTADAYFLLAQQLESRHCEKGRPESSRWNKCSGIPTDTLSDEAERSYRRALEIREKLFGSFHVSVAECLYGLARINKEPPPPPPAPVDPRSRDDSGAEEPHIAAQAQLLGRAVEIYETVLGVQHPECAELSQQLALCYQEVGLTVKAAPCIRKSFVVFAAVFGVEHPVTRDAHKVLQSIEVATDSGLGSIPIGELSKRIEAMEFADDEEEEESDAQVMMLK